MKSYELTYLISSNISEDEAKIVQEKVNTLVQEQGGTPKKQEIAKETTKIKLGYPIEKENIAYLISLYFDIEPEKIIIIKQALKEEPSILRHLILNEKPIRKTKKKIRKILTAPTKESEKSKKNKVELKEIEKKLDEILK